jgi:hypothetical protein
MGAALSPELFSFSVAIVSILTHPEGWVLLLWEENRD